RDGSDRRAPAILETRGGPRRRVDGSRTSFGGHRRRGCRAGRADEGAGVLSEAAALRPFARVALSDHDDDRVRSREPADTPARDRSRLGTGDLGGRGARRWWFSGPGRGAAAGGPRGPHAAVRR